MRRVECVGRCPWRYPMQIHVPSALAGVALASAILLSMSQSAPVGPPRIEYGPNPRDMVQIREGTPYTVPSGRLLVVTGLGSSLVTNLVPVSLTIGGHVEATTVMQNCGGTEARSVVALAAGLTVPAGAVVEVLGG